ncbi:hypothetical protein [Absidia glauca]|uniref:WW domain-containing protein n=1 Tax=Absidia glauca TaxID=4829 RepID=A0A168SG99_ABSGL|nr:hypothetical protein [Absidia glauca]
MHPLTATPTWTAKTTTTTTTTYWGASPRDSTRWKKPWRKMTTISILWRYADMMAIPGELAYLSLPEHPDDGASRLRAW